MTISTIRQIKQQIQQLTNDDADNRLPLPFWLTDWLLHVIEKPAIALMTEEDYQLTDSEVAQFNAGVVKMQQGIPLAYLTGQQEFWSLTFSVNEHTLIPRPDTEVLVEQVLNWINDRSTCFSSKRLLDLGTGSGCIAISLAHELRHANWQVVAVDLSSVNPKLLSTMPSAIILPMWTLFKVVGIKRYLLVMSSGLTRLFLTLLILTRQTSI